MCCTKSSVTRLLGEAYQICLHLRNTEHQNKNGERVRFPAHPRVDVVHVDLAAFCGVPLQPAAAQNKNPWPQEED